MNIESTNFSKTIIDLVIKIGFIAVLGIASFNILSPFITLIIWSFIITISLVPLHNRVSKWLGNSRKIAAVLITLFFLTIIIGPFGFVMDALIKNLKEVSANIHPDQLKQLEPSENIKSWPLIGNDVFKLLEEIAQDKEAFVEHYKDKLLTVGQWLIKTMTSAGKTVLLFFGAMLISGFLLMFTGERQSLGKKIGERIAGDEGVGFATLIENTIRSVVTGVLGVAVIQALLAGIGFFVMGIPFAGLWTILALLLAMIQVGVGPIAIGAVIYGFSAHDTTPAVVFLIWNIIVVLSDNVLKPVLMGRGLGIPMLVIFIGALGGMIYNGILGLFLGPVILAMAYKLFITWLNDGATEDIEAEQEPS